MYRSIIWCTINAVEYQSVIRRLGESFWFMHRGVMIFRTWSFACSNCTFFMRHFVENWHFCLVVILGEVMLWFYVKYRQKQEHHNIFLEQSVFDEKCI